MMKLKQNKIENDDNNPSSIKKTKVEEDASSKVNDEDITTTTAATDSPIHDSTMKRNKKKKKRKKKKGKSPLSKKKEEVLCPMQRQTRLRTREADDPNYVLFGGLPDASTSSLNALTNSKRHTTTIQYSDSYVDLFTRDLSLEECNRMEGYLLSPPPQTASLTTRGIAIPHWTCIHPIFLQQQQKQIQQQQQQQSTNIPSWWSHEISQQITKPTWKALRYHAFYDSEDYAKLPIKKNRTTSDTSSNCTGDQNQEEEELIQSSPLVLQHLAEINKDQQPNQKIQGAAVDIRNNALDDNSTLQSHPNTCLLGNNNGNKMEETMKDNVTTLNLLHDEAHSSCTTSLKEAALQDPPPPAAGDGHFSSSYGYHLSSDKIPIQRACTVLAYSIEHPDIFAIGDTAGYISIYTHLSLSSINRLETDASRRHRHSSTINTTTTTTSSSSISSDPPDASFFKSSLISSKDRKESLAAKSLYSIEAMCFVPTTEEENIAYATKHVVEILSPRGDTLWTMNLDGFSDVVLTMDACPFKTGRLCIGFQEYFRGSPLVMAPTSSIPEEIGRTTNSIPISLTWEEGTPALPVGPRAIAVWSKLTPNKFLCVVIIKSEEDPAIVQQELIAVKIATENNAHDESRGNTCSFTIQNNAVLPMLKTVSRWVPNESISLSKDGKFVAVASSGGGIRVFWEETLELLGVYGEGIKMHSHTVVWQKVILAYDFECNTGCQSMVAGMEEHEDEVSLRCLQNTSRSIDNNSNRRVYLMAVPHPHREPKDLRDTIHVWDITNHLPSSAEEQQQQLTCPQTATTVATRVVVPDTPRVNMTLHTFTFSEPPSSSSVLSNTVRKATQGIQSLLFFPSAVTSGARLLVTTHGTGECFILTSSIRSSWAGCMYDPDYLTLTNNIDYIEDEDELDYNVDAYREIMLQNKQKEELALLDPAAASHFNGDDEEADNEEDVDVIHASITDDSVRPQCCPWICEPEYFLQSKLFSDESDSLPESADSTTVKDSVRRLDTFISFLPPAVNEAKKRSGVVRFDSNISSHSTSGAPRRRPGRSIDCLIVSSINEDLQNQMTRRETEIIQNGLTTDTSNITCFACRGRLVPHSCGRRLIPEDMDAIRREEEERQNRLKEEEKQKRIEKKKAADLKRKLEIQQRKEEKERERKEKQEELKREEGTSALSEDFDVEDKKAADLMGLLKSGHDQERFGSEFRESQPSVICNELFRDTPDNSKDQEYIAHQREKSDNNEDQSQQQGKSADHFFSAESTRAPKPCSNEPSHLWPTLPNPRPQWDVSGSNNCQGHQVNQQGNSSERCIMDHSFEQRSCQPLQPSCQLRQSVPEGSHLTLHKQSNLNPMNPQGYLQQSNSIAAHDHRQPERSCYLPQKQANSNPIYGTVNPQGYLKQSNSNATHVYHPPERSYYPPQKQANLSPTHSVMNSQGYLKQNPTHGSMNPKDFTKELNFDLTRGAMNPQGYLKQSNLNPTQVSHLPAQSSWKPTSYNEDKQRSHEQSYKQYGVEQPVEELHVASSRNPISIQHVPRSHDVASHMYQASPKEMDVWQYNSFHNTTPNYAAVYDGGITVKPVPSYSSKVLPTASGFNGNQIPNSLINPPQPKNMPPAAPHYQPF
jgi:hypothetical protein